MKKILSILIAVSMLISVMPVSAKSAFTDVPETHWAKEQIETWSGYGVINGYDGKFSPDNKITRGDFAVVLNKLMAYDKAAENRFADLGEKYYTESILKLNKAGVMQGFDGKISPEASLTREEASVMICRALGIETQDKIDKTFSDYATVSEWARPYINAMVNKGLLNGAYGNLNPKNTITRAEVVTILDNAVFPILQIGEYGAINTDKIIVISVGNVFIPDSKIDSKIIITQGVKEDTIEFLTCEINGEIVIDNDRTEFIKLVDTKVSDEDILKHEAFVEVKKEEEKDDGGGSPGGPGGNGGNDDDDDDEEEEEPIDYSEINEEMVANLQLVSDDIAMHIDPEIPEFYSIFTTEEKYILTKIKTCIDDAITHKDEVKLDADYIKTEYNAEISEVKGIYDTMKAEGRASGFHSRLFVNLNSYTLFWLADTLGIDTTEYGINPGDYIQPE